MIEGAGRIRRGDQKEQAVKGQKPQMELKGALLAARTALAGSGHQPEEVGLEIGDK